MPTEPAIELYELGQPHGPDAWFISTWGAGQTHIMDWSHNNVKVASDGDIELVLDRSPSGSSKPYHGGEIQSTEVATTGTWSWTAQAPVMKPGAVFGMFTYKADWQNQPWVEFDFEFVGENTRQVQLAIHMEDPQGNHIVLKDEAAKRGIIDLDFDAAEGHHTYEVSVTETDATFYIDGDEVAKFSGDDMPGGVWQIGPMSSFVDLWAVSPGQEAWAGKWTAPDQPLVAQIQGVDIREGEFGSEYVADESEEDPVDPIIVPPVVEPETPDPVDPLPEPEEPVTPEPTDPETPPEEEPTPEEPVVVPPVVNPPVTPTPQPEPETPPAPEDPDEPVPVDPEPEVPPVTPVPQPETPAPVDPTPSVPEEDEDEEDPQDSESGAGGGCFVATAAYGHRSHPDVADLRIFRDRHLVRSALGRAFIRSYWVIGPRMAQHVSANAASGKGLRAILSPLVRTLRRAGLCK